MLCVPCIIVQYVNNQRDVQFLIINFIPKFLSALHVSKETSRSSSGAQHNALHYAVLLIVHLVGY